MRRNRTHTNLKLLLNSWLHVYSHIVESPRRHLVNISCLLKWVCEAEDLRDKVQSFISEHLLPGMIWCDPVYWRRYSKILGELIRSCGPVALSDFTDNIELVKPGIGWTLCFISTQILQIFMGHKDSHWFDWFAKWKWPMQSNTKVRMLC